MHACCDDAFPQPENTVHAQIAATVALNTGRRNANILKCLGGDVPEAWVVQAQREEDDARGELDLSLHDQDELPEGDDKILEKCLAWEGELVDSFEEFVCEDEPELGRNYALTPSQHLQTQLDEFKVLENTAAAGSIWLTIESIVCRSGAPGCSTSTAQAEKWSRLPWMQTARPC